MADLENRKINDEESNPNRKEGKPYRKLDRLSSAIRGFVRSLLNKEFSMENIRKLHGRDNDSIRKLLIQLGEEEGQSGNANICDFVRKYPSNEVYVYEESGGIIGLLGFRLRQNLEDGSQYGEVSIIVVDENHRRKGIGKKLFDFAEGLAKKHGCKGTWLVSGFHRSSEAHKFYEELGYEVTGYRFVKKF